MILKRQALAGPDWLSYRDDLSLEQKRTLILKKLKKAGHADAIPQDERDFLIDEVLSHAGWDEIESKYIEKWGRGLLGKRRASIHDIFSFISLIDVGVIW